MVRVDAVEDGREVGEESFGGDGFGDADEESCGAGFGDELDGASGDFDGSSQVPGGGMLERQ